MDPRDYCDVFSPPIILGTPNKENNSGKIHFHIAATDQRMILLLRDSVLKQMTEQARYLISFSDSLNCSYSK